MRRLGACDPLDIADRIFAGVRGFIHAVVVARRLAELLRQAYGVVDCLAAE